MAKDTDLEIKSTADRERWLAIHSIRVQRSGRVTVVEFRPGEAAEQCCVSRCRDVLVSLVKDNECEQFAFDMAGVTRMPSGLLGVIASIRKLGVKVDIYNPPPSVVEVLEITELNRQIETRKMDS